MNIDDKQHKALKIKEDRGKHMEIDETNDPQQKTENIADEP